MRGFKYLPFNPNYSLADIEHMAWQDASNNRPQDTSKWPTDYEDAYNRGLLDYKLTQALTQ